MKRFYFKMFEKLKTRRNAMLPKKETRLLGRVSGKAAVKPSTELKGY